MLQNKLSIIIIIILKTRHNCCLFPCFQTERRLHIARSVERFAIRCRPQPCWKAQSGRHSCAVRWQCYAKKECCVTRLCWGRMAAPYWPTPASWPQPVPSYAQLSPNRTLSASYTSQTSSRGECGMSYLSSSTEAR